MYPETLDQEWYSYREQKYVRLQEADTERYIREYKEVYGEDAPYAERRASK